MSDTILSLCDLTGIFTEPWIEAGYRAILVDPQHGFTHEEGPVRRLACTVEEAIPEIRDLIEDGALAMIAAFPPCTDIAISGARWWGMKAQQDRYFQARAVAVAEQCRMIGRLAGVPWLVENPVSALGKIFGPADHAFQPWQYTALCAADNYTKKTCLWTGGGFIMPAPQPDPDLGPPDNRIHNAGPSPERANFRSATPRGFARAVFEANHPTLIERRQLACHPSRA